MGSHEFGKTQVCGWIRKNFTRGCSILDVGACDANWRIRLRDYENMDAVEIFEYNYAYCRPYYRNAWNIDINDFEYGYYDLIIFGDVIEHMTVEDAQKVLKYAWTRCKDMIVAVPFLYVQDEMYGNKYEKHIQDDLTPELFNERYPGFEKLYDTGMNYCYYHKGESK